MNVFERVMQTYAMMVSLTPDDEQEARDKLSKFLKGKSDDAQRLTVEALRFLRGDKPSRTRRVRY